MLTSTTPLIGGGPSGVSVTVAPTAGRPGRPSAPSSTAHASSADPAANPMLTTQRAG